MRLMIAALLVVIAALGLRTGWKVATFDPGEAVARAAALHERRTGGDPLSCTGRAVGNLIRVACDGAAYDVGPFGIRLAEDGA